MENYIVNLNDLKQDGTIDCPYCSRGRAYIYSAQGMISLPCDKCHRMVLWILIIKLPTKQQYESL